MKAILARFLLFISLVCSQHVLDAQDAIENGSPKHPIALKIQAYSPLSLLAEPFVKTESIPLTPRFWTGELELGLSERSSVQVSVGGMKHQEAGLGWLSPDNAAYRITAAYRYYLGTSAFGFRAGPYLSPGFAFARGERHVPSEILPSFTTKCVLSSSIRLGWQQLFKQHLLVDAGLGVDVGFVKSKIFGRDESDALFISAFDYPLALTAATPDGKGRLWGIAGSPSLAFGWLF